MNTLRNLMLAWVLTLPVCLILGAGAFSAGLFIIFTSPIKKILFIAAIFVIGWLVSSFVRGLNSPGRREPEVAPA
jgi:hypothetical protein